MTRQVAKELELLAVGSLRAATEPRGEGAWQRDQGEVAGEPKKGGGGNRGRGALT